MAAGDVWERLERGPGCAGNGCSLFVLSCDPVASGSEYGHTPRGHRYLGGIAGTAKNKRRDLAITAKSVVSSAGIQGLVSYRIVCRYPCVHSHMTSGLSCSCG